jgi:hypothetical protein
LQPLKAESGIPENLLGKKSNGELKVGRDVVRGIECHNSGHFYAVNLGTFCGGQERIA